LRQPNTVGITREAALTLGAVLARAHVLVPHILSARLHDEISLQLSRHRPSTLSNVCWGRRPCRPAAGESADQMRPGTLRLISIYLVSYRRSGLTVCHHVVCVHRTVLLFIWLQVRRSVSSLERTSSRDLSADLAATGAATVRGPSPPHGRVQRRRALTRQRTVLRRSTS